MDIKTYLRAHHLTKIGLVSLHACEVVAFQCHQKRLTRDVTVYS